MAGTATAGSSSQCPASNCNGEAPAGISYANPTGDARSGRSRRRLARPAALSAASGRSSSERPGRSLDRLAAIGQAPFVAGAVALTSARIAQQLQTLQARQELRHLPLV